MRAEISCRISKPSLILRRMNSQTRPPMVGKRWPDWSGCLLGLMLGLASPSAQAHQQAVGLTEIEIKSGGPSSCLLGLCRMEVIHRYTLHDAEAVLMSSDAGRPDLISDATAAARFEAYVAARFQLAAGQRPDPISLWLIGGEVERGYYWVYQEAMIPRHVSALQVTNRVLMDYLPHQINRVNIRQGPIFNSLDLNLSAPTQTVQRGVVTEP